MIKRLLGLERHRITEIGAPMPLQELRKRAKTVVIDDEEDSFPTRALQADGYTLEWWNAISATGLQRLEAGDFDIIILDIQGIAADGLSDTGDGQGILRRIKHVNPHQVVVAFSGQTYDLDSAAFWRMADDAMRKPVTMIQCKEMLDRLIHQHVSVTGYWSRVRALLENSRVPEKKIRLLEDRVVTAAKSGKPLTLDEVRDVVGTIDALQTVFGWSRKIIYLCTLAF